MEMNIKKVEVKQYTITLSKEEYIQLIGLLDMGLSYVQDPSKVFDFEQPVIDKWKTNVKCLKVPVADTWIE